MIKLGLSSTRGTWAPFPTATGTGANQGTIPTSINIEGETAGFYVDQKNVYHGFVRSRWGDSVHFDPPNSIYTFV